MIMENPNKLDENDCTCDYCSKYLGLYTRMRQSPKCRWLTISPGYSDRNPDADVDRWTTKLLYLNKFANAYIIVFEMSDQLRLHMHIVYTVKDRVREYIFLNRMRKGVKPDVRREGMKILRVDGGEPGVNVKVYDGVPRGGIHYLFKDIPKTREYIQDSEVVMSYE